MIYILNHAQFGCRFRGIFACACWGRGSIKQEEPESMPQGRNLATNEVADLRGAQSFTVGRPASSQPRQPPSIEATLL